MPSPLLIPGGTLAAGAELMLWLPLLFAGLLLAARLAGLYVRRYKSGLMPQILLFGLALLFARMLPSMLSALPAWLIPNRWSDFTFWAALLELPKQTLRDLIALPPTIKDVALVLSLLKLHFAFLGQLLTGVLFYNSGKTWESVKNR